MHPYKRSERVSDLIREEVSLIIMRKLKDPRLGFVTVTGVKMTEDLKIARIYVSVLNRQDTEKTVKILNEARGFVRSELTKNLKMKTIPQLEFFHDASIEYGERIDYLLGKIKEEK